jgi:hypothetical protein
MKDIDKTIFLFSQLQKVFVNYYKLKNHIGIEVLHCLMQKHSVDILNNVVLWVVEQMNSIMLHILMTLVMQNFNRY